MYLSLVLGHKGNIPNNRLKDNLDLVGLLLICCRTHRGNRCLLHTPDPSICVLAGHKFPDSLAELSQRRRPSTIMVTEPTSHNDLYWFAIWCVVTSVRFAATSWATTANSVTVRCLSGIDTYFVTVCDSHQLQLRAKQIILAFTHQTPLTRLSP